MGNSHRFETAYYIMQGAIVYQDSNVTDRENRFREALKELCKEFSKEKEIEVRIG